MIDNIANLQYTIWSKIKEHICTKGNEEKKNKIEIDNNNHIQMKKIFNKEFNINKYRETIIFSYCKYKKY